MEKTFAFIGFSGLLATISCAGMAAPHPTSVQTSSGPIVGNEGTSSYVFKGIPYAAPPVGPLRWQPAVDHPLWSQTLQATQYGAMCPQLAGAMVIGNEDCLTLNLWIPKTKRPNELLPVFFFIPGGAHVSGSSSDQIAGVYVYDGEDLALAAHAIVITVNYRVGALGFMAHPKLSALSHSGGSGNYGYLDQVQALRWVRANIAAFGGNPKAVTLLGQSAGAWSVLALVASPLTDGLFAHAIVHSGGTFNTPLDQVEAQGKLVSAKLQCDRAADELSCMLAQPAAAVVQAGSGVLWSPTVDHLMLLGTPLHTFRTGAYRHLPILIGTTDAEESILDAAVTVGIKTEDDYRKLVLQGSGPLIGEALLRAYPSSDYATPAKAYTAIVSDQVYVCPARRLVRALVQAQRKFVGEFHYAHTFQSGPYQQFGPAHGFDLFYIFNKFAAVGVAPSAAELALRASMGQYWKAFAETGDPNGTGQLQWAPYVSANDNYLRLDTPISAGQGLRTTQCDLWDQLEDR
jgi:para-nitrobenzyl esterase